jgi:hypothetical protein
MASDIQALNADDAEELAAITLEQKAKALHEAQKKLRRDIVLDCLRDLQMSRDITGCMAGATALGYMIDIPDRARSDQQSPELKAFLTARNALTPLREYFTNLAPLELSEKLSPPAPQNSVPPPMPKVADVALERLATAGSKGLKAVEIRAYIAHVYHQEIHEKTVGMTLYRLQKKGKVTHDGHLWFLASKVATNSGAATPEPNKPII